jgi:hypothetical protein
MASRGIADQAAAQCWTEMERRLLHGLACEWETALWVLPPAYRERMRPPLFRIGNLQSRWGQWSGAKREICLSRRLLRDHSWDSVREILRHEMAHQLAQEVLGSGDEPAHGPVFQKACRVLRANPAASGDCRLLGQRVAGHRPDSELDRIRLKIRKLMALADSTNPHEAEAAMARAQYLMAKHQLSSLSRDGQRQFLTVFAGRPALRHPRHSYHLANLLTEFYFVQGIWVPAFVVEKNKIGRVFEISGTRTHVQMAGYVHDFISRYIDAQWRSYNQTRRLTAHRRTDFAVGVIEGFRNKLTSQLDAQRSLLDPQLPMHVNDPQLAAHMRHVYPHTRNISRKPSRQDAEVVADGVRIGRKMVLARGISRRGAGRVKRLGAPGGQ